ncbi:MAG: thioredoxin family protein [Lentisphaeria bacterium]|nr:thioredoxin family protein [Lentisphaeria bacterium]
MKHAAYAGLLTAWMIVTVSALAADILTEGHAAGQWTMDFEAAKAYATEKGKPMFIAFSGSDWCGWCKLMDRQVFQKEAWIDFAKKNLTLVLIDFPHDATLIPAKYIQRNSALKEKFDVKGYPTYVLLDAETGAETGRFGAGRDKTPDMMISEVSDALGLARGAEPVAEFSTAVKHEENIVNALREFSAAPPGDRKKLAGPTLAALSMTLTKDPVLLVLLDPQVTVAMIPYLNLKELGVLAELLTKARKAGTPIDEFQAELARLAIDQKDSLSTIRGLMFVYNSLGEPAAGLALLPDIDVLKQVETAGQAKEFLVVLKQVGKPKTALELAFHMQTTAAAAADKAAFCMEILSMADHADEVFLQAWLTAVARDTVLLDALREELGKQATASGAQNNAGARIRSLMGHARIVNRLGLIIPDKMLARQYLRHWQFEFATALARSQSAPETPPVRTSRPRPTPPFVPFQRLVEAKLSPECVALLPREEADLHRFQVAVSRLKSGRFDEESLLDVIAFNDRYPDSVASHCAAFVTDWAKTVNPNKERPRTGFQSGAPPTGIPLTRARQEKNIAECARLFEVMRGGGVVLPDDIILGGFRACFSKAEIISREDVFRVFPDVAALGDEFIVKLAADVIRELRENWINADNRQVLQEQYATNRTAADIDNETVRAYRGMIELVRERLTLSPESIPLRNVMAALSFDLAEFSKAAGLATLEEYTELRDNTFRMFEECYTIYQAGLPDLSPSHYSVDYLKYWFSAVFGASDLSAVDVNLEGDLTQLERVKASLDGMAEPYRDTHKTLFGQWIVSQWGGLKPHVKLNVLQSTLEVLGEHDSVAALVNRMAMYQELLREIKLYAEVDGPTRVGAGRPFGLVLKLRHTDALEREAGGFSKYIQNQQQPYPRARAQVDYRNNFARNISTALKDHFDIIGITWMDQSVRSVEIEQPHWRETPLAYVSLKALDATVDRIPSIQLDMDFRDDTGQVVLPVLSNTMIIDAATANPPPRPVANVDIHLILDTRQAGEGELKLDVVMKGEGILPNPDSILKLPAAYSFGSGADVAGLVLKLEQRDAAVIPHSEQNATYPVKWAGAPWNNQFTFPDVTFDGATVTYEIYSDADIVPADKTVSIGTVESNAWITRFWAVPAVMLAVTALGVFWLRRKKQGPAVETATTFTPPSEVNGLSVLSLLERLRRSGCLTSEDERRELSADVREIEEACFSVDKKRDINLGAFATKWLERVSESA